MLSEKGNRRVTPHSKSHSCWCCGKMGLIAKDCPFPRHSSTKRSCTRFKTQEQRNHRKYVEPNSTCDIEGALQIPWTIRKTKQWFLNQIKPKLSIEAEMAKLNLLYIGHITRRQESLKETITPGKSSNKI